MTRVLMLFRQISTDQPGADPKRLQRLLVTEAPELSVDIAGFDELLFALDTGQTSIRIPRIGSNVADYDVVYLRRIENSTEVDAVGKYCASKGIAVADEELALRYGSTSKLTQYMEFGLAGIPIPRTIYVRDSNILLHALRGARDGLVFPLILKAADGSRGADNHLAHSMEEARNIIREYPGVPFLAQQYIPNTFDYRVWVCDGQLGPILARTRTSGHKNNTSQGGRATLLEGTDQLPTSVLQECVRAAQLLHRTIAGVDVIFENDDHRGAYYILEANRAPQIEGTPFEELKVRALAEYFLRKGEQKANRR